MKKNIPLAERFRPCNFDEFFGQEHLLGSGSLLRKTIQEGTLSSCILWGPPGCGKTSLAKVMSSVTKRPFVAFSAVLQGVADIRQIVQEAEMNIRLTGSNFILFIDEIHRFNKTQQDALLPHVEKGTVTLIGATTENPSFEINSALLSRCQVFVLEPLKDEDIIKIINRVLSDREKGLADYNPVLSDEAFTYLVNYSNGDIRTALNALELAVMGAVPSEQYKRFIDIDLIKSAMMSRKIAYDKNGEEHYNLISALHKSLRGSDPQASLYWLGRMIEGGADPLYIVRRLIRFASEDIGLADPNALVQAVAAKEAIAFIGYPECNTVLAQCVLYLATAPKSNSVYTAINYVKKIVVETKNEPVPLHIRNAPTKLMKNLNYGSGYKYDHDSPNHFSGQDFLPDSIKKIKFYEPGKFGFEKEISKRIDYWKRFKKHS